MICRLYFSSNFRTTFGKGSKQYVLPRKTTPTPIPAHWEQYFNSFLFAYQKPGWEGRGKTKNYIKQSKCGKTRICKKAPKLLL